MVSNIKMQFKLILRTLNIILCFLYDTVCSSADQLSCVCNRENYRIVPHYLQEYRCGLANFHMLWIGLCSNMPALEVLPHRLVICVYCVALHAPRCWCRVQSRSLLRWQSTSYTVQPHCRNSHSRFAIFLQVLLSHLVSLVDRSGLIVWPPPLNHEISPNLQASLTQASIFLGVHKMSSKRYRVGSCLGFTMSLACIHCVHCVGNRRIGIYFWW